MTDSTGNNYGLNDNYDYYEFQFDSKDAKASLLPPNLDPQVAQYNFTNWPLFTMGRPVDEIAALKVLEVQVPFSYYIIHSLNNTFLIHEQETAPGVYAFTVTATIPPGNYNATTLATAIEAAMNAVTTYTASVTPLPYTVSYNTTTKKYTITAAVTVNQTFALQFGDPFDPGFTNPRYIMGMHGGITVAVPYAGPGAFNFEIIGPLVAQVTGSNYLFLNSSLQGQQCKLYLPEGSFNQGQIGPQMAKIPVTVNPGGVIYWQNPDPQKWFNLESSNNINNIDLYFTQGNEPTKVDFNGVSFSVTIGVLYHVKERTSIQRGLTSENRVTKRIRG